MNVKVHCRGHLGPEGGQELFNGIHHLHRVRARLALDGQENAPRVVKPAGYFVVLDTVEDLAKLLEAYRGTVAVGHDERAVDGRFGELAGGLHRKGFVGPVERPRRQVHVGPSQGRLHIIDADPARGQRIGVQLHPHGVFLRAKDQHLRYAADHGKALGDEGLRIFVHGGERQGRRAHHHV